ncbi:MAG TPA: ABC transporter substrate-binding protein [Streptosporangiaceae bacterium]|nr:ABC transporter substrate-binding protein [Streptosporangiaceae bacterium]
MDRQEADREALSDRPIARRSVLKAIGAGALVMGADGVVSACSSGIKGTGGPSASGTINIGFVTPLTGPLAGFASGDQYVLGKIRATSAYSKGIKVGGKLYKVNIVVKDSQSSPTTAGIVANELILSNKVDLIVTTSTPETTTAVTVAAERHGTPCVSTVVPWESWYLGLGGSPASLQHPTTKFQSCTMFFFGLKEFQGCFVPMWNRIPTNKTVACMYPNDTDGNAFRLGFEPLIRASGYKLVDGGAYTDGTTSFTSMISKFKSADSQIFSNAPLPPDFNTFWKQAVQQGFKPRLATVAKVLLFPADALALTPPPYNVATDSWWGPYLPYTSSLTGESAASLSNDYETSTGKQWVQSIGSSYSLFEVAYEAFKAVSDPHDNAAVANALHGVNYTGMCGPLNFSAGPAPGVGIIRPLGVQWKKTNGDKFPVEMLVVDNSLNPDVKIQASLQPTFA